MDASMWTKIKKITAIQTKGKPIALLVASNNIRIPKVPIFNSMGTLNPKNSFTWIK